MKATILFLSLAMAYCSSNYQTTTAMVVLSSGVAATAIK
uniref:Uncharacterized protein n=1 Tax=Arundo donax TaxID=35708 RepID=A0A0A8ZRW8_ARUDO